MTSTPGSRRTTLGIVFLVLFLDLVGFGILFPLYPEMLRHYLAHGPGVLQPLMTLVEAWCPGADEHQRAALFGGIIGGGYALLQFFTAPFWGRLSDRIGRRPLLLMSLSASVLAYLAWMLAGNFTVLLLSRLIAGVMGGAAIIASAAVADLTPDPKDRARGMAAVGMAFGLGFILGPVLGGLTYYYLPRLDHGAWVAWGFNPFSTTALIAAGLSLINLVWAWRSFAETLPVERRDHVTVERSASLAAAFGVRMGGAFVVINTSTFFYTAFFSGMESTLGFLVAQRLGYEPQHIGGLFGAMGVVAAVVQGGVFRRCAPRFGVKPLVITGFWAASLGFAIIATFESQANAVGLWCGVLVLSLGTGLIFPGLSTLTSLAADAQTQGAAMGGWRSASALGRAAGPLLAAVAYFRIGPATPYWIGAFGLLLPLAILARSPAAMLRTIATTAPSEKQL